MDVISGRPLPESLDDDEAGKIDENGTNKSTRVKFADEHRPSAAAWNVSTGPKLDKLSVAKMFEDKIVIKIK